MKKKIEIEIEVPDSLDEDFLRYLTMLDDFTLGHVKGFVVGTLCSRGKISTQEAIDYTVNKAKKD